MEEDKNYINMIHGDLERATQVQSGKSAAACLMNRVIASMPKPQNVVKDEPEHPPDVVPTLEEPKKPEPVTPDNRVKAADLEKRLSLLK